MNKHKVNIVCYGKITKRMKKKFEIQDDPLRLYPHGDNCNINIAHDFEDFNSFLKGEISPITKDLIDIATLVYMADRYIPKEDENSRDLNFLIPVRKQEIWNNNIYLLKKLIGFLIRDNVNFYFEGINEEETNNPPKIKNEFDSVICFSGGLDSFIGTIELIKEGYKPVIVSHFNNNFLSVIQSKAYDALSKYLSKKIVHCKVYISKSKSTKKGRLNENYSIGNPNQVSRSFLFLSIATALAFELDIDKIFLCENGILSINLPISESRFNTKTAHPILIDTYQKLINNIFGREIIITNPFIYKTKSEMLKNLDIDKIDYINETVSCWNYARVKIQKTKSTHCGYCFPCIIRRISARNAFPFDIEKKNTYLVDIFNDYPYNSLSDNLKIKALFNINDLVSFAARFLSLNEDDVQLEYPELFINMDDIYPKEIIDMYFRFAKEVINVTNKYGNDELKKFVKNVND